MLPPRGTAARGALPNALPRLREDDSGLLLPAPAEGARWYAGRGAVPNALPRPREDGSGLLLPTPAAGARW